jgi:hypothetical protein
MGSSPLIRFVSHVSIVEYEDPSGPAVLKPVGWSGNSPGRYEPVRVALFVHVLIKRQNLHPLPKRDGLTALVGGGFAVGQAQHLAEQAVEVGPYSDRTLTFRLVRHSFGEYSTTFDGPNAWMPEGSQMYLEGLG